jgi:hypothetical protein
LEKQPAVDVRIPPVLTKSSEKGREVNIRRNLIKKQPWQTAGWDSVFDSARQIEDNMGG